MVREAATLNLMFLSDLSGLEPLPPVRVLVTSFEACTDDRPAAAGPSAGDDGSHAFSPRSTLHVLAWTAEGVGGSEAELSLQQSASRISKLLFQALDVRTHFCMSPPVRDLLRHH